MYNYESDSRPYVVPVASLCTGSTLLFDVEFCDFVSKSRIYRTRTYVKFVCVVPLLSAARYFGCSVSRSILRRYVVSEAEYAVFNDSTYSLFRKKSDSVAFNIDYRSYDKSYRVELAFEAYIH